MADRERKSSGLLILVTLIVGVGGAVAFGWWWWTRAESPFERLPAVTPIKVSLRVAEGDRLFGNGMKHLTNSDPGKNPEWLAENRAAMDFFTKSRDSYLSAQDVYGGGQAVPYQLLDRIRESSMRLYLCRKRIVGFERR